MVAVVNATTKLSHFFVTRNCQGDEIRELKKSKPDKATITPFVEDLKALKAQYKAETGKDYAAAGAAPAAVAKAPTSSKTESGPKQAKKVNEKECYVFYSLNCSFCTFDIALLTQFRNLNI